MIIPTRLWAANGIARLLIVSTCFAQAPPVFQPAPAGCAMAHCDVRMSDNSRSVPILSPNPTVVYHDPTPSAGAGKGLGCSSNGSIAVCTNANTDGGNVVAYAADGSRLWDSGSLLNHWSYGSVAMINSGANVIAADNSRIIRFSSTGQAIWNTTTPGGVPISPIVTQSGIAVLATTGGPVSAFDSVTGALVGSLFIRASPGDTTYFDTANTPCTVGNRIYISTRNSDSDNTAWLVALDVDPSNTASPLTVAWHFTFGGPSGASPTCIGNTIYFDGGRLHPGDPFDPRIFAVRDDGATGTLVWTQPSPDRVIASFAQDPRGGFWIYYYQISELDRRSTATGELVESLKVAPLVGDANSNYPYSAMTMSGSTTHPAMVLGTVDALGLSSYIISIDLAKRALAWRLNINPTYGPDQSTGQFPIVMNASGKPVVVAAGASSGPYFIAAP